MNFCRKDKFHLPLSIRSRYHRDKLCEMEEEKVSALVKKLDSIVIPPKVARELGLSADWKKNISPAFVEQVAKTAVRHEDTLKELSKY